jgi:hypothetical protein
MTNRGNKVNLDSVEIQDRIIRLIAYYEQDKTLCTELEWNEIFYRLLVRIKRSLEKHL